jgi:hypothetical protein
MFSSACIGDSRQEQDVSFQDVLMAVESQVMTILSYGQNSFIEVKMFPGSKEPVSSQGEKK